MHATKLNHRTKLCLAWRHRGVVGAAMLAALLTVGCGKEGNGTTRIADDNSRNASATTPAPGAEIDGEMYGAVNGERRKWYVAHVERDGEWQSGSFWRSMSLNNTTQVTIFGLPDKTARPTGKGDVMISLVVQGESNSPRVISADFTYFADGYTKTWTSEQGGAANVVLNRFIFDGEYLDIGGGFSGVVGLPDLENAATETDAPRQFEISDGSFAVRIRKLQR